MAQCDQGYLCSVCSHEVEDIRESDLYLRYVIGELDPEVLHTTPERHIRCNPALAQFIVADGFEPLFGPALFDKRELDPEYVQQRESLVTRGWERLQELFAQSDGISVHDYPLSEMRGKFA